MPMLNPSTTHSVSIVVFVRVVFMLFNLLFLNDIMLYSGISQLSDIFFYNITDRAFFSIAKDTYPPISVLFFAKNQQSLYNHLPSIRPFLLHLPIPPNDLIRD